MSQNQTLEQQLESLVSEIEKRKQESPEDGQIEKEHKAEKEHLHDIIGEKIYGNSEENQSKEERHEDLPATHGSRERSYNLPELHDKIQELVDKVFEKDLDSALKEVQKSDNEALIDAFHDALVDELHDHLVNQGKLKKL